MHGRNGPSPPSEVTKYDAATKRRLMGFLARRADRGRPVVAAPAARVLGLPGRARETRRRRFRELIEEMRTEGAPIASSGGGYFLATEVDDFAATERFLRRMGLGRLATAAGIRRCRARSFAAGQLELDVAHGPAPGRHAHDLYLPEPPRNTTRPDPPPREQCRLL